MNTDKDPFKMLGENSRLCNRVEQFRSPADRTIGFEVGLENADRHAAFFLTLFVESS
jgi:hypothetical protein